MAAPAAAVAREYHRLQTVLLMLDVATELHLGELVITEPDREDMRADLSASREAMRAAMRAAMRLRGVADFRGEYASSATKDCAGLPSMWAEAIANQFIGRAAVTQDGHELTMRHELHVAGGATLEVSGTAVEDMLVFSDPMNSDFVFVGHAAGGTIVIRPDADFFLGGWPDGLRAPKRSDLRRCRITMSR